MTMIAKACLWISLCFVFLLSADHSALAWPSSRRTRLQVPPERAAATAPRPKTGPPRSRSDHRRAESRAKLWPDDGLLARISAAPEQEYDAVFDGRAMGGSVGSDAPSFSGGEATFGPEFTFTNDELADPSLYGRSGMRPNSQENEAARRLVEPNFPTGEPTIEIRALPAQKSAAVFLKQIKLFQARIDYLRRHPGVPVFKLDGWLFERMEDDGRQFADDVERARSFYFYVTETGLSWRGYRSLLEPELRKIHPYHYTRGPQRRRKLAYPRARERALRK